MFTLIEAISLAGDRAKQNDDVAGVSGRRAWVIDGATDLHAEPLSGRASDASWIAQAAGAYFASADESGDEEQLRRIIRAASVAARAQFEALTSGPVERWKSPIASVLIVNETELGVTGLDLGDCRLFALGADGNAHALGGRDDAADEEAAAAARQTDSHLPLMQRSDTLERLRRGRARLNQENSEWTFCLDPACADHARAWSLTLKRPAHMLLMTDGFAALADRYGRYDPVGLVGAALEQGLQELGRELRAIETADAATTQHPRFKASDDATALLLRLM
jgi:hypothetical protein